MKQRSVLWVVLAVLVVGAGALVMVVGGGSGDGDDAPPRLPLAAGSSASGDARAETAADMPDIALASVYVPGDGLPALGGEAPAYRLTGDVGDAKVRDLADALGIDGEPTGTDGSWHVEDGEMALDVYGPDGSWSAYRMIVDPSATTASPDTAASSGIASGSGSAGSAGGGTSGSSGSGSSGSPGAADPQGFVGQQECPGTYPGADNVVSICEPPLCPDGSTPPATGCEPICLDQPDVATDAARCEPPVCPQYAPGGETPQVAPDTCVPPACPGSAADDFRCLPPSTVVEPRPADPDPLPTEPAPVTTSVRPPAPDLPDEDAARAAALDLLETTGADVDDAEVTAENLVSMWSITVEPSVEGRPAPGLAMYVAVGPEARIESASGRLTEPDALGEYPLIDTRDAVTRLNEGWGFATPLGDVTAADVAEGTEPADSAVSAEAAESAEAPGGTGADPNSSAADEQPPIPADEPPVMTIEPPEPGTPGPPVDTPPPNEVEVTDAEIVLVTVPSWDDSGTYLVPGYRFTAADGSAPTVPAVTDDVLEPPPDGPQPLPDDVPVPESGSAAPGVDGAGDRVEVSLYHCGFDELRRDGRRWVVERPPFDETNAPPEFVGKGTFTPDDGGHAVYTDDSGVAVTFTAVEEDWAPPPCA